MEFVCEGRNTEGIQSAPGEGARCLIDTLHTTYIQCESGGRNFSEPEALSL